VAESQSPNPGPFDVKTVKELIELMDKFDLSEVDLNDGDQRIRLRRGGKLAAAVPSLPTLIPQPVTAPVAVASAPAATAPAPAASTPPPAASGKQYLEIKSELVGTFYSRPAPDKEPFVKVGSKVTPDTVVCTVEAMKIFNSITAKVSGTIAEILVKDGQFVEYDQVLFKVDAG
jgi:acetyl-CoA carboxylase biotin carboxyl carrier protein